MVAWHLLGPGFLIVLAPALGKARMGGVLPFPALNMEEGVGKSGMEGGEQLRLFCSCEQCEAALPCETVPKDICGMALRRVKARFKSCVANIPCTLEPPHSWLSFPPWCDAAPSLTAAP